MYRNSMKKSDLNGSHKRPSTLHWNFVWSQNKHISRDERLPYGVYHKSVDQNWLDLASRTNKSNGTVYGTLDPLPVTVT